MDSRRLRARVGEGGLLAAGVPVLAMFSGGRDSTCLLDVAVALLGPGAVRALHVNYGLRAAAAEDERHCRSVCERLGVELHVHPAAGERPAGAGNLQAWARDVRYREANRLAGESGGVFATGHTASDQVETIVYRLAASPGRRALLGMPAREGRMVRPLLLFTREQTAAYCRERGLQWREDESNSDERFARTRVREGVLPELRSVHPAAESNVLRTAALLREETELLDGLVEAELDGRASVETARLRELPRALARMVVVRLAERVAGTYVPQAGTRLEEILALDEHGGRSELHVGGGVGAVLEGGVLEMVKLPPRPG
ncbi:MAG TPA: tRNA lysidine(34) synthetase TilS [Solirubrobacteraceae bacterium]|nr:tRNA lysidine(34) synthetase TilS [Solirubrobacteraceae bacterium]